MSNFGFHFLTSIVINLKCEPRPLMVFYKSKNAFITPLSLIKFILVYCQILNHYLINIVQVELPWLSFNILRISYGNLSSLIELNLDRHDLLAFENALVFFLLTLEYAFLVFVDSSEIYILTLVSGTFHHFHRHDSTTSSGAYR
jgi:hypothetical protein